MSTRLLASWPHKILTHWRHWKLRWSSLHFKETGHAHGRRINCMLWNQIRSREMCYQRKRRLVQLRRSRRINSLNGAKCARRGRPSSKQANAAKSRSQKIETQKMNTWLKILIKAECILFNGRSVIAESRVSVLWVSFKPCPLLFRVLFSSF